MNWIPSLIPAALGVLIVLQAGLNRKIATAWGLPSAVLLNGLILACGAAVLFAYALIRGGDSSQLQVHIDGKAFAFWFIFPGLIGLTLVFGGPWSIARWGAVQTFVTIVSAQLFASLIWDWQVEGIPASKARIAGVILAWLGVLLASRGF